MKSPGGSEYPYYYKSGEIHCLKYGSKYKDKDRLFDLMEQEEAFINETNKELKIWIDLYKTTVTREILLELLKHLNKIENHVNRISFVGLSAFNRWRLRSLIKKSAFKRRFSFYSDPEAAKTWLITES